MTETGKSMMVDTTKKGGFKREVLEAWTYHAVLFSIVDLGTQYNKMYDTTQRKVRFGFEIPWEMRQFKEGEPEAPFSLYKEYTRSFSEKSFLRKDLESWGKMPEDEGMFDLFSLIWENCYLSVGIKKSRDWDREYNTINSITALPKWIDVAELHNEPMMYLIEDGVNEVFKTMPEFLQRKIDESEEFKALRAKENSSNNEDDDLPF